jgi:16S rRNA (cytidine1402-2'-O)-methyltransferase
VKGKLLLLPNLLDKESLPDLFFPPSVQRAVLRLDGLVAENQKEGRAFLKRMKADYRNTPIELLNKHQHDLSALLEPIRKGETWGLISDAGLPVLADPGYQLVARAREFNVTIQPFVGPSSIVIALMVSGLPSQRFAFNGYLPRSPKDQIKKLEKRSRKEWATQVFIEAPFRNGKLLDSLLETLDPSTKLCVAWDLTMPTQGVETHTVSIWKKRCRPTLHNKPAVFLFSALI